MMRAGVVLTILGGLTACAQAPLQGPAGASTMKVRIDSAPTPAWIFIDGTYVGRTPLTPEIPFTHATRYVEVVAVPMYDSQTRQALRLVPPSLPQRLQFFLDNQDPRAVTR
jgi:hypothetical protein